ncbi:MAG: ABC transporter permease [Anaerolineae bacterium]
MSERRSSRRRRLWVTFRSNQTALLGVVLAAVVVTLAVLAPWVSPHDPLKQNVYYRLRRPEPSHPMGVDDFGRDVLSRILWGARTSLVVGISSVLVGMVLGTIMGIVAGFKGGPTGYVIMRAVDVLLSFPTLIMGLMVMAILGSGMLKLILAIGVVMSPRFARVAHGPTLSVREQEFVQAARAVGASDWGILRRHILPNIFGELLVMASLWTATAIRIEANLSFIGLGVPPPTPTWGNMIRDGVKWLTNAPYLSVFPGLAILITVLAFNMAGDGLRDVADPKLQV